MALVLKALDRDGGEREIAGGRPFFIGRGPDNDWVLDDPGREISKIHCRIDEDGRAHLLTDLSINGVHLEREGRVLGRGNSHRLAAGDVFAVGHHRFGVVSTADGRDGTVPRAADASGEVSDILGGHATGGEGRASAAMAGEAQGWLGTLPLGAAAEGLAQPLGWTAPPATDTTILPADFDQPPSRLADASEHAPATSGALFTPRAAQVLPVDWFEEGGDAAGPERHGTAAAPASDAAAPRRGLAEGARVPETALSDLRDPALFARAGALIRTLAEGLDALETAQAAAEHDCGLSAGGEAELWTDFLSTARDPCVKLLTDPQEDALGGLARRIAALADRQRALGAALAEAGATWDRRLAPDSIAAETVPWFAGGPFGRAILWGRYADAHAAIAGEAGGAGTDGVHPLMGLVRRAFARRRSSA